MSSRRKKGFQIDGFVLTEHRNYNQSLNYDELASRYNAIVLRGIEVETDIGHVLVYGAGPAFFETFDLSDISLPYEDVFRVAWDSGGIAVGAHAGRPRIGALEHVDERNVALSGVSILETLNGGSNDFENARAHELASNKNIREVGGSDSHFVSTLGACLTRFQGEVSSISELVEILRSSSSQFIPLKLEETLPGADIPESRPSSEQLIPHTSGQGELGGEELEYDRSVVGKEIFGGKLEVTSDAITKYCDAIDETNPIYVDSDFAKTGPYAGIIAPPGILQTAQVESPPDPNVKFGTTQFMAGSHQEYLLPIRPGDTLDAYVKVKEVYEKTGRSGRMVFIVRQTRWANQFGENVALLETSMVIRQIQ
jgi:acyl dehydratase